MYVKLVGCVKGELIWVVRELVDVSSVGVDALLVALLRRLLAGILYHARTSSKYFLLRITPEMELHLRFLLTHVKLGSQKRHRMWFARKHLSVPERGTLIIDIVRFICCGHHPRNEIIQSDIIPRWAVIGWLLTICRKKYIEANVKLALFYDWLFFDDKVDNIMNIELAILLMNYDLDRKDSISKGVATAIRSLVNSGVFESVGVLSRCEMLTPSLRERTERLLRVKLAISYQVQKNENKFSI
ncbi:hypothetical protein Leryth_003935 [Lithospermum erythrorhizon]|nr:hypothetical protein Leryth_003935 [Lithospermum erythrorhizon]